MNRLITSTNKLARVAHSTTARRLIPQTQVQRAFSQTFNKSEPNFTFNNSKQQKRSYASFQSAYPQWNTPSQGASTQQLVTAGLGLAALIGVGYYGIKYMNKPNAVVNSSAPEYAPVAADFKSIPDFVHEYLFQTYKYVVAGLSITAASAVAAYKTGLVYKVMNMGPWVNLLVFGGGTIGAMVATQAISPENKIAKHAAFTAMNVIMGVSLCTLGFMHPQILVKAGLYTTALFSGLSFVAMNAKEERFLYLGGPLMAGLCVLIVASLSSMILPARFAKTLTFIEGLMLYGGLALFSAFILYDTQKLMFRAKEFEVHRSAYLAQRGPNTPIPQPDYVSQSISLYLDFINIFIRMVMILSNSQNKRK